MVEGGVDSTPCIMLVPVLVIDVLMSDRGPILVVILCRSMHGLISTSVENDP